MVGFRGVADTGNSHLPVVTNDGYNAAYGTRFRKINTQLEYMKFAISDTNRYCPFTHELRYAAYFCYPFNRRLNLANMVPQLE